MTENNTKSLYLNIIVRMLIISSLFVPLGALYIESLVTLTGPQIWLLIKTLLWLPALLLVLDFLLIWRVLAVFFNVMDRIYAGEEISEQERTKAERRALTFPYMIFFFSIGWFSLGGYVLALIMVEKGALDWGKGIYIIASAVTCGVLTGIASMLLVRGPMRISLQLIFDKCGTLSEKPPFFIPISIKLSASFVFSMMLIVLFLGMLSYENLKSTLDKQIDITQSEDLLKFGKILDLTTVNYESVDGILAGVVSSGIVYCRATEKFNPIFCSGIKPSSSILDKLSAVRTGTVVADDETGYRWTWTDLSGGKEMIIGGWMSKDVASLRKRVQSKYILIALVIFIVGTGLGIFVALDISRTIKSVSSKAAKIAGGDVEVVNTPGNEDETGILARAFNLMAHVVLSRLRDQLGKSRLMLQSITGAVQTLAPMSKELVAIAEQQASGSIEQASAAEQAATTSEEIVAVSKQIAQNAQEVSKGAEGMLKLTEEGQSRLMHTTGEFGNINEKMRNIADAVLKLGNQSQEIGGIVQIIDEISEQTNLLALNASIEAVGAGEHGRRFGVVAQEIRRLSHSTAESTRKIKDIVKRMQDSVSASIMHAEEGDKAVLSGKRAIEETTKLFDQILESNNISAPRLKEIGLMTSQQASASEQMAKTITEVKDNAQQSSAAAGELKASISELETIVIELQTHVESSAENEENPT